MDFDKEINRRGSGSLKWDACPTPDVLPLWVADMDFQAAPCIIEALRRRVEHGIFGYERVPDTYYDAVISWFSRRHGWDMKREWILCTPGVVPALSAIVQAVTRSGRDKVIVQNPVYNCFFSSVRNNGCEVLPNPLVRVGGTFRMDYDDLRRKAADPAAKALILCNPHNPAGRVWTREELLELAEICLENNVFVIADEIHNELTMPGHAYTPYGTLGEAYLLSSAICTSPSKAFNIAGLQMSNITVADPSMRRLIDRSININEVCDVNPFGVEAAEAAYSREGERWLEELRQYLWENYLFLRSFFLERVPQIPVIELEGTYLVLIDCAALRKPSQQLEDELLREAKVWFNAGRMYDVAEDTYLRINIACTRKTLEKALQAFSQYVQRNLK
ncbi:MAG: pyridoxal phosphate-dependent aminotransferase [Prevotellaceae bacterium]|nr:pyridoxal phosphate-dependent aminotransferase [Prevotellaceae bacterium]